MIRIRTILYKISLLFIFLGIPVTVQAQYPMGARGAALGHATTALTNYSWAIFSNPAMLSDHAPAAGFYGIRNYGFSELMDISAYGNLPTSFGVTGIGLHRYGDDLFSETRLRAGYKNEWNQLHFGVVLNYNHLTFGGTYGSGGAFGIDIGIAAQILDDLWIGAKASNLNQPQYHFQTGGEDLARDLSFGLGYRIEERALFLVDIVKDVRFPVSIRSGLEVYIVDELAGRVGITTEPLTYSGGLGYGKDFWEVNIAVQQHTILGLSPGLDLIFEF